jgi:hypothetical protein
MRSNGRASQGDESDAYNRVLGIENDPRLIIRLSDPAGMGFATQSKLPLESSLQAHLQDCDQGHPYRSAARQQLLSSLSFNPFHPLHPCAYSFLCGFAPLWELHNSAPFY